MAEEGFAVNGKKQEARRAGGWRKKTCVGVDLLAYFEWNGWMASVRIEVHLSRFRSLHSANERMAPKNKIKNQILAPRSQLVEHPSSLRYDAKRDVRMWVGFGALMAESEGPLSKNANPE